MRMSNGTKINLLLFFSFIGIWTCKQFQPKEKVDEIVIGNIRIPKKPCIGAINDLFGKGVDSIRICDCLIPNFYSLIKHDSLLVEKFKEYASLFKLEGALSDSFAVILAKCVKTNILDSSYKFSLTSENELVFKKKLRKAFKVHKEFKNTNTDGLSDCIVSKLNGNITISEYFSDDYFEEPKIKKFILECIAQAGK
jgi:hypothetical protein